MESSRLQSGSLFANIPAAPARRRGMSLLEPFLVAFEGLTANKLRSFLTMLGIIVGVTAVIVMVALGQGAAQASAEQIKKLGTNRLYIRPESRERSGVRAGADAARGLTLEDAEALRAQARLLEAVAPEYRGSNVRVQYRGQNSSVSIYGSTPEYFGVRNMTIAEGRLFNDEDVRSRARVAVLGDDVAKDLFGDSRPVGKTIRIQGQRFQVIGLLKRQGAMPYANKDDEITIPISTAMRRLFGDDEIRSISVQAVSMDKMREAEEEIYSIIRKTHRIRPDEELDIRIFNQADVMETASAQGTFLTMLLAGIAVVSLVVGGIGIMNIMLVSVTERTREIGIRKAIGAKRRDILYQFLIESITMSLAGGLIGIALGIGIALWMGRPQTDGGMGFPMLLTLPPIVVSFGSSAIVGIFFGIYPAIKASGLDPIEALRYE